MKTRRIVSLLLCVVFLLAFATACGNQGGAAPAAPGSNDGEMPYFELSYNDHMAESSNFGIAVNEAIANIKERTDGHVVITPYYGNTLLEQNNQYAGVSQGMADISVYTIDSNTGTQVLAPVFNVPYASTKPTQTELSRIYSEFFDDYPILQEENAAKNIYVMSAYALPASQIHAVKDVIETPEDFAGMKVIGSARSAPMINLTGACLTMAVSEYFNSLEKGVAQAHITGFVPARAFGVTDLLTTHTLFGNEYSGVQNTGSLFIINKGVWDSLPKEYQDIIQEEYRAAHLKVADLDSADTAVIYNEIVERGDTIINLTGDQLIPWREACEVCLQQWLDEVEAAGFDRAEAEAMYNDLQARIIEAGAVE